MTSTPARFHDEAADYLLTREVAELLRTPESTVRYWRHVRTGPPSMKVGRRVLYSRVAVLAWLEAQCSQEPATVPCQRATEALIADRVAGRGPRRRSRLGR